jgi:hypothetical protein
MPLMLKLLRKYVYKIVKHIMTYGHTLDDHCHHRDNMVDRILHRSSRRVYTHTACDCRSYNSL